MSWATVKALITNKQITMKILIHVAKITASKLIRDNITVLITVHIFVIPVHIIWLITLQTASLKAE